MQQEITIEYVSGDKAVLTALTSDYARWEKETNKPATEFGQIWDIFYVAYQAYRRSMAGRPIKDFDNWMDSVADIKAGGDDPKVTSAEVSID